jgi:hypothetical protein
LLQGWAKSLLERRAFPSVFHCSISESGWSSSLILLQRSTVSGQREKDAAKLDAATNEADDVGQLGWLSNIFG